MKAFWFAAALSAAMNVGANASGPRWSFRGVLPKISVPVLLALFLLPLNSYAQWTPTGRLASVPVLVDCNVTGGDIAVVRDVQGGATIFHCPQAAYQMNAVDPGVGHFYFVHEFGHIAAGRGESDADCWAAKTLGRALNGRYYIDAAVRHFRRRGLESRPGYPTAIERARLIESCAG